MSASLGFLSHLFHVDNGGALRWRYCFPGLAYVQDERYAAGAGMRGSGQARPVALDTRLPASYGPGKQSPHPSFTLNVVPSSETIGPCIRT